MKAVGAVRAVRAERGCGHTLEAVNTSYRLENPNQGWAGGDNGRGVNAVSGGGSEGDGGDDVEWLGEALRAVGVDEALRAVGAVGAVREVRVEGVWAHIRSLEILLEDL